MQNPVRPVPAPRELSVFGAVWQYRRAVAIIVVATVALSGFYGATRPRPYVAQASLILQPSSPASSSSIGAQDAARFTADQLTILRSHDLITKALAKTRRALPGVTVNEGTIRGAQLVSSGESDVIAIRVSAGNERVAVAAANAIGLSYEEVRQAQAAASAAAAVDRINKRVVPINERLAAISNRLAHLGSTPADDARAVSLAQEQKGLLEQRANLIQQRGQLSGPSQAGSVSIFIPANIPATRAKTELPRLLAVAVFLGLLLGAGFAYFLALRRRTFADSSEIELVVGAPMLGEIPDFSAIRRTTGLSHVPEIGTPAAEAFRSVAMAIAARAERGGAKTVMIVSALTDEGKTAITASVAIAAASEGARILVVDADPRCQALTRTFESVTAATVVAGTRALIHRGTVVHGDLPVTHHGHEPPDMRSVSVLVTPTAALDLLIMVGPPTSNSWLSEPVRMYFQAARDAYDLVLIDTPGLLSSSEAAAVAAHVDGAIVVVPEDSGVAEVSEVVARLRLVGIVPLGYVHNLAPLAVRRDARRAASASTVNADTARHRG